MVGACTPPETDPPVGPTPTFERSVVVDVPVGAGTVESRGRDRDRGQQGIGTPETVGEVIILAPVRCGAVTLSQEQPVPVCEAPELSSGALDGRAFVAAVSFDLKALPAGSDILYAGLEMTGLASEFLADYGRWYIRMIEHRPGVPMDQLTYDDLAIAPTVGPDLVWRLRSDDLAPGGRNTLVFEESAREVLAENLGNGPVTFRIDGPSARTNLFSWEAEGYRAPRLRIAYIFGDGDGMSGEPLILWDDG